MSTPTSSPASAPTSAADTDARSRMREQVEKTVEVIRPALRADGGDIILHGVDAEAGIITVELIGACVGCPASSQTL
jgi:Fe-S cluster biogenesis protein NfuA